MIHPARSIEFDELLVALRAEVGRGMVCEEAGPDGLVIFRYAKRCTYENGWNPTTVLARGLVLDLVGRRVVATPFPKFFNLGERRAAGLPIPDGPFEAFEKLDGSLGIWYFHAGRWRLSTVGAFDSYPAVWGEGWMAGHANLDALVRGTTYLVEVVCRRNKMVVSYPFEGCVLLAAYDEAGMEFSSAQLADAARETGMRAAGRQTFSSFAELVAHARKLGPSQEGYVVRFADGTRLKVKGDAYCEAHRRIEEITPLGLWQKMRDGEDLDAVRLGIPEEFWGDFDTIRSLLDAALTRVLSAVEAAAAGLQDRSDREVGPVLSLLPADIRGFVFPRRRGGPEWFRDTRSRAKIFEAFRPDGNRLAGYEPSTLALGFGANE